MILKPRSTYLPLLELGKDRGSPASVLEVWLILPVNIRESSMDAGPKDNPPKSTLPGDRQGTKKSTFAQNFYPEEPGLARSGKKSLKWPSGGIRTVFLTQGRTMQSSKKKGHVERSIGAPKPARCRGKDTMKRGQKDLSKGGGKAQEKMSGP